MRQTFVFRDGQLVPKEEARRPVSVAPMVMGDIKPFVSPIDRSVISSRSELRAHEQKHGVRQCGNDWTGSSRPAWWDAR
jgi:hypothetical protein